MIMLILLIVTGVQLYKEKKENKKQYQLFLNRLYVTVGSSISQIDHVLREVSEGRELERSLLRIEHELEKVENLLDSGRLLASLEIGHTQIFSQHPIVQFSDDDKLTKEERQYLKDLKEDLQSIRIGMYSEETEQENPNLSMEAFNDILSGSQLPSGFLTENRSVSVPFQRINVEQSPEHIQKWLKKNAIENQKKIFLVEGKTYVVLVPDSSKIEMKTMYRKDGIISVDYTSQNRSKDSEQNIAIAEIDMEINRSFQFTSPMEDVVEEEDVESNNDRTTLHVSGTATVELISPERLSKDGSIVSD